MATSTSTGYGPRHRIIFDGDERQYELWEVKFLGFMKIRGLDKVLENIPTDATLLDDQEHIDQVKNSEVYAELVQVLDDTSLSLIIRDADNDGRGAIRILRSHYLPKGKPRVITLYTELTSLIKSSTESVTDYLIRAETYSSSLKNAGETIEDSLLVAMILKGLPPTFKSFITVITQKEQGMKFSDFKVALRNYEDTEKLRSSSSRNSNAIMYLNPDDKPPTTNPKKRWCRNCKSATHDTDYCRRSKDTPSKKKGGRWCAICKSITHDTKFCRKLSKFQQMSLKENLDDEPRTEPHFFFVLNDGQATNHPDEFLVDSGATVHVVNRKTLFKKFNKNFHPASHIIELADGTRCANLAEGQGDAETTLTDTNGRRRNVVLKNALYVPSFDQNIFSVQAATESGAEVAFGKTSAQLHSHGTVFNIRKNGKLFFLNSSSDTKVSSHTLYEWHIILGHCNKADILKLEEHVSGMIVTDRKDFNCEVCALGKMTDDRSRKPDCSAKKPLDTIHVDLAGPIEPEDKNGMKYSLVCVDSFTNITSVYFLKHKSDAAKAFKLFLADISPYGKVKIVRSDQGGEFLSNEFQSILIENKIKHEKTAPYSPHQNGKAERTWRSLFEMSRCLLLQAGLPKSLWTYAVLASAYTRNRCFNKNIGCTPFQGLTGRKPNISNMRAFGSVCYAKIQNPKKLDDRSEKGFFIGYDRGSPSYLVYFPETLTVRKVRCVKFFKESQMSQGSTGYAVLPSDQIYNDNEKSKTNDTAQDVQSSQNIPETAEVIMDEPRLGKRNRTLPKYLNDYVVGDQADDLMNKVVHYCYSMISPPTTYKEAMSCKNSEKWQEGMSEEMQALGENDTYELTILPTDRKAVGGKWVYTVKSDQNGNEKYKARFVAKGYSQIPDIDYQETFSPTARITSIRTLVQFAVQNDLLIHQMDVKAAYLNAEIDCELYVQQPEGYVVKSRSGKPLVLKLKKSLYGLKQSGRNWNSKLHTYLTKQGFVQSLADPCVYTIHSGVHAIIIVWVDDIIIAASNKSFMKEIKTNLSLAFQMKDFGTLSWFLGIEFIHEDNTVYMTQKQYINKMLDKFGMTDCKPKHTPSDANLIKFCSEIAVPADERLYREIVGSLIYVMTATRPDLCYIVTKLSQYMSQPTQNHMISAKHALRYLKATCDHKLVYRKSADSLRLVGNCDADWGNSEDRKSTTGYGFMLQHKSLISWKSRKQPTIALSTCEAEYMAMCAATQEGLFLKALIKDMMGTDEFSDFTIHCDNQGAIALGKNPVQHQRSKHIDIKYHFIRNEIQKGIVNLLYVPTDQNWADMFTKPITRPKLQIFQPIIMGE